MKKDKQDMLEHVFKATQPAQIKKILMLNHSITSPVLFSLLSRPNYVEKTLALGEVVDECLTELSKSGKNLFNFLLTYRPVYSWRSSSDSSGQNSLQCYLLLFNHFRKNKPELLDVLINTPDAYGYIPISKMITHYKELTKELRKDIVEEQALSLINLTCLNYCAHNEEHLLNTYVKTVNTLFKYNKIDINYNSKFLIQYLDLLIDSGLDLNLPLPKGGSAALNAFKHASTDVLNLFIPHFNKIDFSITNETGEGFRQILEQKDEHIKIHFEKYLLNQTLNSQEVKKSLKI